jgi:(p)ppGpp synthase/HD superfamily hydrolase
MNTTPLLTQRFEAALIQATRLHSNQLRKGTQIPYVSHLLAVASLVLEEGGTENEAIAALLHDAVEDQGGQETLAIIQQQFGEHVASLVEFCSDTVTIPKPPWRERKEQYLAKLKSAPEGVWRIVIADKLHNARSILSDLHREGTTVWLRFKAGQDGTLWLLQEFCELAQQHYPSIQVTELAVIINQLAQFRSFRDQ